MSAGYAPDLVRCAVNETEMKAAARLFQGGATHLSRIRLY
jgi:hypothetical protein